MGKTTKVTGEIAGVVLAGGRSSRMGTNKALLRYRGRPLVEYMGDLLRQAGCNKIYISGEVNGYDCIPDKSLHDGPSYAMANILKLFDGVYRKVLFVPVDMPLIKVKALQNLLICDKNAYYTGYPLPACLVTGGDSNVNASSSVKELLVYMNAAQIEISETVQTGMVNVNTQEEWKGIIS